MKTEHPQTLYKYYSSITTVHYCILLPVLQSVNLGQNSKSRQNPTPVLPYKGRTTSSLFCFFLFPPDHMMPVYYFQVQAMHVLSGAEGQCSCLLFAAQVAVNKAETQ